MNRAAAVFALTLLLALAVVAGPPFQTEFETLNKAFQEKMPTVKSREEYQATVAQYQKDLEALLSRYEKEAATDELELWRCEVLGRLEKYDSALAKADLLVAKKSPLADRAAFLKANFLLETDKTDDAVAVFRTVEGKIAKDETYYTFLLSLVTGGASPAIRREYAQQLMAADLPVSMVQAKKQVESVLKQLDLVGKPAPAIAAGKWLNSPAVDLAALKGKVVLLDFWAPWCGPCRMVIPHLVNWFGEFKEKGLVVIGFTKYYGKYRDEVQNKGAVEPAQEFALIQEFVTRHKIPYPIAVAEKGDCFEAYAVLGIPTLVVIDKKGNVADLHVGSGNEEALKKSVEALLAAK